MSDTPTWYVGNRDPSITATLERDGTVINLTGSTVKFRMRAVGSTTLKVDAAATVVAAAAGTVRYDWAALDVDTAGSWLTWWQITDSGGKTEDIGEVLITIAQHGDNPLVYIEPELLKSIQDAAGTTFMDTTVTIACRAATRAVELCTKRRFWPDADANQARIYTPTKLRMLQIDDLITFTRLEIDRTGDTVYEESWTLGTDFVLEPVNAAVANPVRPYEWIKTRRLRGKWFPVQVEQSVKLTGKFGWLAVPDDIKFCTAIIAERIAKRMRESPFGIVSVGGPEGHAMRIARYDPDVAPILNEYGRGAPWL